MSGALKRDEWETVRLGDVCEVNPSKKFNVTISDDLNVGFLPMEAVSNEGDILRIDTRKYGEVKKGFSGFQDGDVLIAKITPCMENGKGALVSGMPCGIGFGSTEFHVLRPDTSKCHAKFIFHIMENPLLRQDFARKMTGSAGQRRLPKEVLQKLEIPLPSLDIQRRIAETLDKVTELITLRKTQLKKLDELVKARFVELFSDCKNIVAMNDLCSIITDGTHQPPKFQSDGIPFIFVSNLANNTVTYNAEKFISEETYNDLIKRTPIEIGDILLTTVGSYGHPAVVVEERKFLFQRHIAYLKLKHDLVNSFYLHSALLAPDGQRQIEEKVKGIAQKTLNLSEIRKIMIPIPSIEEQNAFELFIKQTDKSKVIIQQSLDTLETLKKSLMQEYFG